MKLRSIYRHGGHVIAELLALLAAVPVLAQPSPVLPHAVTNGLADLRNDRVHSAGEEEYARGRSLLEECARAHGLDAWERLSTAEITGVDRWSKPGPWWPHQNQRVRLVQLLGTFSSQAHLLDGPGVGQVWGIQSWRAYTRASNEAPSEFSTEPNPSIEFYLPTLHYFNELPFRLLQASTVVDAGTSTLADTEYQLLFVTWGDPNPRSNVDHYMLWINKESGLIEKAHYTVRDAAELGTVPEEQRAAMRAGAVGTIHFSEYRWVQGVRFPFQHVVTIFGPEQAPPDPMDGFLHAFLVDKVRFDAVPGEELVVGPELPLPADSKPQGIGT